jgi:type IV secretory pathway TrbD component
MPFWYFVMPSLRSPFLKASLPMSFNFVAISRISVPFHSSSLAFWSSGKSSYGSPIASETFIVVFDGELAAVDDGCVLQWLVAALCLEVFNLAHNALAVDDLTEDDVLLIEVRCRDRGYKELGAICSWPGIGHAQQERLVMDLFKVLVLELLAVDALAACPVTLCEIAALNHEALDDAVEARILVVERLAGCAFAFLAGT